MKRVNSLPSAFGLTIAEHVGGDPLADVEARADAIDGLWHLAVAAVAPLDGVGGRRQQGIVEEGQGLLDGGGKEFAQRLAEVFEAADSLMKLGEFGLGGLGAAAAVEETVDLIDDLPQHPQARLAAGDPVKGLALGVGQMVLDKEVAMLEQVRDLGFDTLLAGRLGAIGLLDPPPAQFGRFGPELAAHRGHGLEDGFVHLGDDMELTDLMPDVSKHLGDGRWVQVRPIGGDAAEFEAPGPQGLMEPGEEPRDVFQGRRVVQDLIDQAFEPAVVHDRQDAIRSVVDLVGGDVARKALQGAIEVVLRDVLGGPFPPASTQFWIVAKGTNTR